jgi:hypothetical protein
MSQTYIRIPKGPLLGLWLIAITSIALLSACSSSAGQAAGPTPPPAPPHQPTSYVVNGIGGSNVEQAHAQLQQQGNHVYLIVVSSDSPGIEGQIYRDLIQRNIRATVGPDEGFDTHGEFCYPNCVFVPREAANAISVQAWVDVLRHEYRHITQAENNPNMAQDFRNPSGEFTTYAAFEEACADYGLNVAPIYHAQVRMDQLKNVLGPARQSLIERACAGDKNAYQTLLDQYDQRAGQGAFALLFPPFR